jgi:4-amino-4-deoxy-L-arabinose transferase-like glycosyltransferase
MKTISLPATSYLAELRYEWICVSLMLILGLIYRLSPMNRGLGQDELYTAVNFIQPASIWTTMSSNAAFNNHIGYSVMARLSARLFGDSEWSLRLPALLLGLASLYLFWILTRPILSSLGASIGVLLLALSPPHVVWSVEARGYSAMIFFTTFSSIFYFRLLRRPTRFAAFGYLLANLGGIYTHLYSVFVVAIQFLIFAQLVLSTKFSKRAGINMTSVLRRLFCLSLFATAVVSILVYLPVATTMLNDLISRGHGRFDPAFPWAIIQRLSGSEEISIAGFMFLVAGFGGYVLRNSRPLESRYFIALFVVPALVTWVAQPFDLYPRFFAYWLPFYIILFVVGLAALWHLAGSKTNLAMRCLPRAAAAIVLISVIYHWVTTRSVYIPDEGYREASSAVISGANDGVRYCAIGGARSVWRYYIHQPIATPASLKELEMLTQSVGEVRCVYYDASWQDDDQREIAEFLRRHADWQKIGELTVFRYMANQKTGRANLRNVEYAGG